MQRRTFLTASVATGASVLAAPAVAQGRKTVTIVSTWPRDLPGIGTSAQRLAARITELSEGRLTTEYFAAGERVGAFDVFDEVASGNSPCYVGAEYYWTGKNPAFGYFTAVPFGMTTPEWNSWIKYGGGQELWDEISGGFGLKCEMCGSTGTQAGGWFNREINSAEDLRGLKMRIPGLGGATIAKLGVSVVSLPGSQVYESLVSGTIDATEWVGPYNDFFMKFYEAAKIYYTGGMHEPGGGISFGMNASWYGGLTSWEKAVIRAACLEEHANAHEEAMALNGVYLKRLVEEHGVSVRDFNEEVWDAFGQAAAEVYEETRSSSELAARINDSFHAHLRLVGGFMNKFEGAFVRQRNRVLGL